jgi:aldehyde:ferredoxin oxidoreductase
MYGYWGKILRVDLTSGRSQFREIDESFFRKYLGGAGLGAKVIYDEMQPGDDALGPGNIIVFGLGPFNGLKIAGAGKGSLVSRSPLTGLQHCTNMGGEWAHELKNTGCDSLYVTGKSQNPVYLWIRDKEVEIRDARFAWGKSTSEARHDILADLGDKNAKIITIGPAGERLVRFACTNERWGFGGRGGIGAVFGSKNLKAVAIRGTSRPVEVADRGRLDEVSKSIFQKIYKTSKENLMQKYGTQNALPDYHDRLGYGLYKYWSEGKFEIAGKGPVGKFLNGDAMLELRVGESRCSYCPIGCKKETAVKEPHKWAFPGGYGPEYETMGMLGWQLGIADAPAVSYLNNLCNEYGIDTVSTGSMLGLVAYCLERKWLTKEDVDGVEIDWGETDLAAKLIEKIAKREGFGRILGEGIVRAANQIGHGAPKSILHSKGLDYPAHDPRAVYPQLLNYSTGPSGANHQQGFASWLASGVVIPEWGYPKATDFHSMHESARIAVLFQDWANLFNSLVQCEFMIWGDLKLDDQIQLLNCVTGWEMDHAAAHKLAERISTLQRLVNVKFGVTKEDDHSPSRMMEPLKNGPNAGKAPSDFQKALDEYYDLRGWDSEGRPTATKIAQLEL